MTPPFGYKQGSCPSLRDRIIERMEYLDKLRSFEINPMGEGVTDETRAEIGWARVSPEYSTLLHALALCDH